MAHLGWESVECHAQIFKWMCQCCFRWSTTRFSFDSSRRKTSRQKRQTCDLNLSYSSSCRHFNVSIACIAYLGSYKSIIRNQAFGIFCWSLSKADRVKQMRIFRICPLITGTNGMNFFFSVPLPVYRSLREDTAITSGSFESGFLSESFCSMSFNRTGRLLIWSEWFYAKCVTIVTRMEGIRTIRRISSSKRIFSLVNSMHFLATISPFNRQINFL